MFRHKLSRGKFFHEFHIAIKHANINRSGTTKFHRAAGLELTFFETDLNQEPKLARAANAMTA